MIDTHCHLDRLDDPDAGAAPELAALITVGTGPDSNERALSLAARHANVWAAVGIHPGSAALAGSEEARAALRRQARQPRVVAIGETGFDTHWDDSTPAEQLHSFRFQAELAAELDLPLILHVRDAAGTRTASSAACAALRAADHGKGVLHCFNGDPELLQTGLDLGWYVSFAGNVTYRNAPELQEAARSVPRERLLAETDSPYLTPVPLRGRPNTPAYVRHTVEFLATLLGVPARELEDQLDANAHRLFGLGARG